MADDLVTVMARAMLADTQNPDDPELDVALQKCFEEHAQAALAAIQQYGIVFFKYETAADGTVALKHIDWKDVYEPPAAALAGREDETI